MSVTNREENKMRLPHSLGSLICQQLAVPKTLKNKRERTKTFPKGYTPSCDPSTVAVASAAAGRSLSTTSMLLVPKTKNLSVFALFTPFFWAYFFPVDFSKSSRARCYATKLRRIRCLLSWHSSCLALQEGCNNGHILLYHSSFLYPTGRQHCGCRRM